ncbi:MAG TPA: hypothetical protein VK524_07780 [Polyangiaceae bacterium]|nr:hypothetical protein [Polyangiaceae bacterium]
MNGRRIVRALCALGMGCALLQRADVARANGRYPQAMQLAEDPSNAQRLWLRTTYGLIVSPDRGASWSWICEDALGFDPNGIFDPMFGVHADGTVVLGLQAGLGRSTNGGCDWQSAVPALNDTFVHDVAVDPNDRRKSLALSSQFDSSTLPNKYVTELWETTNNGANYTRISRIESDHYTRTVDAAPSNPNRVYLSGSVINLEDFNAPLVGIVLRSDNRGQSWTRLSLPVAPGAEPYIAAVHPTNPDIVYVRTYAETPLEGGVGISAESVLLYTDNGGTSWRILLTRDAPMLGFALSPDGTQVLAGFGDEGAPGKTLVAPASAFGIWRSPAPNFDFQRVYDQKVSCLAWTPRDIFVCSRVEETGFDLGVFTNSCPPVRPLFSKKRMNGPLACASGSTTASRCTQSKFQNMCDTKLFCSSPNPGIDAGVCPEGGIFQDAGSGDASVTLDAGTGSPDASVSPDAGAPRDGGTGGSGGRNGSGGSTSAVSASDSDTCTCMHAGRSGGTSPALLGGLVALGFGLLRRRSRA